MSEEYIAALNYERANYEARGRKDRVAQVDAELARVAASEESDDVEEPEPESTSIEAPDSTDMPSPRRRSSKES